jgi:uroporphyrinogen decarboxylase
MKPDFERFVKVLWGEEPDRVPFYEHLVDNEVIEAIIGEPIPALLEPGVPRSGEASKADSVKEGFVNGLLKFYKGLGYDYVPLELPLNLPRTNIRQGKDPAPLSRGMRTWVDENRGTIEKWEDYESYPWPDSEDLVEYDVLDRMCGILPESMKLVSGVAGGVLEHALWLMGLRPFSIALFRDPKLIGTMFDKIGSMIVEVDKRIAENDKVGAMRMGDDMAYKSGPMISPENLRKYVFPWQKRIVDIAHSHGKPFILHSCGNLRRVIDDLIDDVGIDAWHSFQDNIMPVTEAKEKYGHKVALLGGVDVDKLCRLPVAELEAYTRNILEKCMPGGGYALGSGNSITNYMKIENYKAMLKVGTKHGKYPTKKPS